MAIEMRGLGELVESGEQDGGWGVEEEPSSGKRKRLELLVGGDARSAVLRCADVSIEVLVPAGSVPSARTLGHDLRRRLMSRLYGEVHTGAELVRRARSAAAEVVRTFYVGDELDRVSVDASVSTPLNALEAIVGARIEVRA